jgi:guanylate kinase
MRVVSISGASGVGKTTLQEKLIEHRDYRRVLSHTTRSKRDSDREGEYCYLSVDEFFSLNDLLWSIEIHSNHYATSRSELCEASGKGKGAVIVLSVDCVLPLRKFYLSQQIQHVAVHLLSPSEEVLRQRLQARGGNKKEMVRRLTECSAWDEKVRTMEFVRSVSPMSPPETLDQVVRIIG